MINPIPTWRGGGGGGGVDLVLVRLKDSSVVVLMNTKCLRTAADQRPLQAK